MHVNVSMSVELANTNWVKTEILLDEVDLMRLLVEQGFDPEHEVLKAKLSTTLVFKILESEAQRLLLATMVTRFETALRSAENLAKIKAYQDQRDAALATLR